MCFEFFGGNVVRLKFLPEIWEVVDHVRGEGVDFGLLADFVFYGMGLNAAFASEEAENVVVVFADAEDDFVHFLLDVFVCGGLVYLPDLLPDSVSALT